MLSLTSMASANTDGETNRSRKSRNKENYQVVYIEGVKQINGTSGQGQMYAVAVSKGRQTAGPNKQVQTGSAVTDVKGENVGYFIHKVNAEEDSAYVHKVDKAKFDEMAMADASGSFSVQSVEQEVTTQGIDAINDSHIEIVTTGDCDSYWDAHHEVRFSLDLKEKVNDIGLTTAGGIVSTFLGAKKLKVLAVSLGAGLALVTNHSDLSYVYREADNGPYGAPVTHSYITGGYKDYDWDNMYQWTDIAGHVVPSSLP